MLERLEGWLHLPRLLCHEKLHTIQGLGLYLELVQDFSKQQFAMRHIKLYPTTYR